MINENETHLFLQWSFDYNVMTLTVAHKGHAGFFSVS